MRKLMLGVGLVLSLGACSHSQTYNREKADYEQWRAERAAKKGDVYKEEKHEIKANEARQNEAAPPTPTVP